MNHELISRYIYAATRRLPAKLRGDVEQELASLISDMLEARCGAIAPEEKDIRIVLTELGAPGILAAKYSGEGRALIGGEYFLMYKFVLKLVLPIAAAGVLLAHITSVIVGWQPGEAPVVIGKLLTGIPIAFGGVTQAFAIITFIFAIFEWKKVKFNDGDFIDALPLVPVKNEVIKPWEPIAGMVLCVLMGLVFLAFPQVIGGWMEGADWIPALNESAMRALWLPIILWAVLGIGKEIVRLIEGRYTRRLAIVSSAANPVIAACAVIAFGSHKIINPEFLRHITQIFGEGGQFIEKAIGSFHLILLGIVFFALIVETVTFWVKACKYSR